MIDQDTGPADPASGDEPRPDVVPPPQAENSTLPTEKGEDQEGEAQPEPGIGEGAIVDYTAKLANWTRWLAILTGVLAVATIGMSIIAFFQWKELQKTDEHIGAQLDVMRAGQRAWIAIEGIRIGGDLFIGGGHASITLKVTMRNTGNLPALNVNVVGHIFPNGTVDVLPPHCSTGEPLGRTLFPQQTNSAENWAQHVTTETGGVITPVPEGKFVTVPIAGCVVYRSAGDTTWRMTAFSAIILPVGGPAFELTKNTWKPEEMAILILSIIGNDAT